MFTIGGWHLNIYILTLVFESLALVFESLPFFSWFFILCLLTLLDNLYILTFVFVYLPFDVSIWVFPFGGNLYLNFYRRCRVYEPLTLVFESISFDIGI
jgi:hypothetical protein